MKHQKYTADTGLAFLLSQLTYIESKMYEVLYKAITYNQLVPITNEAGEGSESITYFYMDGRTIAEFVGSRAVDAPLSEITTEKITIPVELGATAYEYSDEELRQAIQIGRSLPQMKANVSMRGYEEHVQRVAMFGDDTHNLPGFLNNANVTSSTVVDPGSGTEWVNKTPDEIIFDLNDIVADIFVDSLQVESADRLALPTAQWSYIASTPRADNSDTSILDWFVGNSPYITSREQVIPTPELAGAGAGATDRMMAYTYDPDKVIMHIPMPIRYNEPRRMDLGYRISGQYKIGGIEFRYPGSARYADGI